MFTVQVLKRVVRIRQMALIVEILTLDAGPEKENHQTNSFVDTWRQRYKHLLKK